MDTVKTQRNTESDTYPTSEFLFAISSLALTLSIVDLVFLVPSLATIAIPFVPAFRAISNGVRSMTRHPIDLLLDAISVIVLDIVGTDTGILEIRRRPSEGGLFFFGLICTKNFTTWWHSGDKGSPVFCRNEKGKKPFSVSGRVFISRCP